MDPTIPGPHNPWIPQSLAQEKWELGGEKKKNPSGRWDEAAGPGSTTLAPGGMEFPFPTLGFGVGAKPVLPAQHGAFPFSHSAPSRGEAMGSWEGDYPKQMIKIQGKSFGKVALAQGMPGREVLPFHHFGNFSPSFFLCYQSPFIPPGCLRCPS